jgi:hypothetical protein
VLSGCVTVGGVALEAGNGGFTIAGEEHDVVALSDAMVFVCSQKARPIAEP